jgi:multiple sugar transport system substrate-binding protein
MEAHKLSRRQFLKFAAVAGSGLAVASCVPAAPAGAPAAPASVPTAPAAATTVSSAAKQVTVNVMTQPRPEWDFMEKALPEFEQQSGVKVVFHYLAELERRSKSMLDASTGAGQYQVYYVDEANIAQFATNKWALPIKDYYPSDGDFAGFSAPLVKVHTFGGVPYTAPMSFEGDMVFYRKDLFTADKIAVPTNLDEYLAAAKHFQKPPAMYGNGTRGLRGSGMNVWRFSQYLLRFGGNWLDANGVPIFNTPEAAKAVAYYLELIKLSPGATMSWSDVMDSFGSGKEAIVDFAHLKMDTLMNPAKSTVTKTMGYSKPPAGPAGEIADSSVHGLAISAGGAKTEEERVAAGKFIGWFTSAASEIKKVKSGNGLTNARTATFASPEFAAAYPAEFAKAMLDMMAIQRMCIPQIPQWPEIGDYFGIKLEELGTQAFAGQKVDIQAALDDSVAYAKTVLAKQS